MLNFPSHSFNVSVEIPLSLSQDKTCFSNSEDILQEKIKCSMDCAVPGQKEHIGKAIKPKR